MLKIKYNPEGHNHSNNFTIQLEDRGLKYLLSTYHFAIDYKDEHPDEKHASSKEFAIKSLIYQLNKWYFLMDMPFGKTLELVLNQEDEYRDVIQLKKIKQPQILVYFLSQKSIVNYDGPQPFFDFELSEKIFLRRTTLELFRDELDKTIKYLKDQL